MNPFDQLVEHLHDVKDAAVLQLPLPHRTHGRVRTALLWGPNRKQEVVPVLFALAFVSPQLLEHIAAVSESAGVLGLYLTACKPDVAEETRSTVQRLATKMFGQQFRATEIIEILPTDAGALDWEQLPVEHTLHKLGKGFRLGRQPKPKAVRA